MCYAELFRILYLPHVSFVFARMTGYCSDLLRLRSLAERAGRVEEATRLSRICVCMEGTLEADDDDMEVRKT